MNDFASLRVLDRFRKIFLKFDIDYDIMRRILQLKLTMDSRRLPPIFNGSKEKKDGNQFTKSLWVYGLFGLLLLTPFLFLGNNFLFSLTIMFSSMFVILMTSMISDFSAVLLDIRDKNILQPKPISNRTINAAKIMHILIYIFLLTGSFVIIPLIVSIFKFGPLFSLLFLVEIGMISGLTVIFTAFIYLFVLRFFSGEFLKDVINYVQIFLAIGMAVSYQLVGRIFDIVNLDIGYSFAWWHLFLPPLWYAAPFELIFNNNYSLYIILFTILALIIPIIAVLLYVRLMPTFENYLSKLQSDSNRKKKKARRLTSFWSSILCSTKEERAFYKFSSMMLKEERELKLKVYPMLGFAVIFPFIMLFNNLRMSSYEELANGNSFMIIYFSLIFVPSVVLLLEYSNFYKAHWVFYVAPMRSRGLVYSATLKATIINYFLPILIPLSLIFLWIFTFRIWLDLVIVLLVAVILTIVSYWMFIKDPFPFSNEPKQAQESSMIKVFGSMFLVGVMAFIHKIIGIVNLEWLYILVLIISIFIGWKLTFFRSKPSGNMSSEKKK
ncbi:hypothetical protein [Psychrobacillus sp. BL-248-WT-3]|uniref:hypothetical protein n=1 Tax=Psychrobacillus sp. BL-248-WT-3 TaxID=2725306 RepID=UPI00146BA060|nr:hypothetical protein [Psychrobacillus sp. BL-248-WT-3]NME07734.1 hypothetical protein [Psychrobacillus sp. BL-248-WT-3]